MKKLTRALFIPAISLLPFTASVATPKHPHPVAEQHVTESAPQPEPTTSQPPVEKPNIRSLVTQGTMPNSSTIQINMKNLSKLHAHDQRHIISLIDKHGVKQRYILLSPSRSNLIKALTKNNGQVKEFDFYTVIDEKGEDTHLLASKRTVTAPANQLTLVFKDQAGAQLFLTQEQQALEAESIYQANAYSQEINSISQKETEMQYNDGKKSSIGESVHLFPMAAAVKNNK